MRQSLLSRLRDPEDRSPLTLESSELRGDDLVTGCLRSGSGRGYPITDGIPRFVTTDDAKQLQTARAFAYQWRNRESYDSAPSKNEAVRWYLEKYGFASYEAWSDNFAKHEAILDVGCGGGFSSSLFLDNPRWTGRAMWVGADISGAIDVAQERLAHVPNTHFVQGDALALPFADGAFDAVFSEGVLHHTPSTRSALLSAVRVLASGGEISFYVYRKKAPLREFTDDFIRAAITDLDEPAAWDAMRSLTHLAQVLSEASRTIKLEQDVPLLGIRKGEHDIQRLIYWHFAKLYWNANLSFEENVHMNFDWYRPHYAFRHTAEEVRAFCEEARLDVTWFHEQESGYTVRGIKR